MSTHNLCFEQEYEEDQNVLSENFPFWVVKFSIYLNRRVFVITFCSVLWFCKRTAKALHRLCRCAGRSGPSLSTYARRHVAWCHPCVVELDEVLQHILWRNQKSIYVNALLSGVTVWWLFHCYQRTSLYVHLTAEMWVFYHKHCLKGYNVMV